MVLMPAAGMWQGMGATALTINDFHFENTAGGVLTLSWGAFERCTCAGTRRRWDLAP